MKADLFFYDEFCGGELKIPVAEYPRWERCAENELLRITGGKSADSDDERLKICICEMAEILYTKENLGGILSESTDGYSVSYEKNNIKSALYEVAKRNLSGTNFLYRGVLDEN